MPAQYSGDLPRVVIMSGTGADQDRQCTAPSRELSRAIHTGPFELAIKLALRDSGLSLDRISDRLTRQGLRVSASSLSNWQTGRSRPERAESIRALRGLERLLGLPSEALLRLLGPRRSRGRWVRHVPGSVRYDALFDDHDRLAAILAEVNDADDRRWRSVCVDECVTLDRNRRFRTVHIRQLITALVDGVDGCVVLFHAEDGPVPEIVAPDGCRLGRTRTDADAGITVAELLLDHRLDRDDVVLLEYQFRFAATDAQPADYYYRAFRDPCRYYLLRVRFNTAATPVRCRSFRADRVGSPFLDGRPLPCQRGRIAHLFTADSPAGIVGIRWEWR